MTDITPPNINSPVVQISEKVVGNAVETTATTNTSWYIFFQQLAAKANAAINGVASVFGGSGPGHSTGLVPDPGLVAGSSRFLNENGTFIVPTATNYQVFGASGTSHASGLVPDPGGTPGVSRFLREDSTFDQITSTSFGTSPLDFGAAWNGGSNKVGQVLGSLYVSASALAGYTVGGLQPYSWATNPIYGIAPFTQVTGAAATAGATTLIFTGANVFAQVPFAGQSISGTNIPNGTIVTNVAVVTDFKATVTISNAVQSGGVASGATITFAMTPPQIQAIEMDWLAMQTAIVAACGSVWGQQVIVPTGEGVFGNNVFAGLELVVPIYLLTGGYWQDGTGIKIAGQGLSTSVMSYPYDLGAGRFAIKSDPAHIVAGICGYQFLDFALIGSPGGIGQATFGAPRYQMSGVMFLHKTRMQRCDVSGFFASAYIATDHNYIANSNLKSSGYSVYFGSSPTGGNGNTYVENVDCGNSLIGAIGIAWNNWASDCVFRNFAGDQCATFAYKENQGTNTAALPSGVMFVNCLFDSCATEGISSSIFYDYNAVNHGNYVGAVTDCTFLNCLFSVWGGAQWRLLATSAYFPSMTVFAAYDIGSFFGNKWINGAVCSNQDYGIVTLGIIRAPGGSSGNDYQGCGYWLLGTNGATAAVPSYVGNVTGDTWSYNLVAGYVDIWIGGTASVGQIITSYNNSGIINAMIASPISGQSLTPAVGVLAAPVSGSCGVGYVTKGRVVVNCNSAAGIVGGQALYVDHSTPSQAQSASGNGSGNVRQYLGTSTGPQATSSVQIQWQPGAVV